MLTRSYVCINVGTHRGQRWSMPPGLEFQAVTWSGFRELNLVLYREYSTLLIPEPSLQSGVIQTEERKYIWTTWRYD